MFKLDLSEKIWTKKNRCWAASHWTEL